MDAQSRLLTAPLCQRLPLNLSAGLWLCDEWSSSPDSIFISWFFPLRWLHTKQDARDEEEEDSLWGSSSSPNLCQPKTHSHTSVNVSFDGKRRRGHWVSFPSPTPHPPSCSLLLNMQIQQRMRQLAGSLQELGQWRRHSVLKRGSVSLEAPSEGLALMEERKDRLQLNCGAQLRRIDVDFPAQWCDV